MQSLTSLLGLFVMIFLAWLLSAHRTRFSPRVIVGGLLLQFAFAVVTLKTAWGRRLFEWFGDVVSALMGFTMQGSDFVFGVNGSPHDTLLKTVAFGVLPTIIFFSALMSVLYHYGVMQKVVHVMAVIMQRTLGTSGAESLSASANIFVGQTEAPLLIRPFVPTMTRSELMAVMVGGFATIAGGVMAVYVSFGIDAGHLLTASVISAPAALLIAKVMQPEVEHPKTLGRLEINVERLSVNGIDALAIGAADGLKLALNVAAMLIAFIAMVHLADAVVHWVGARFGYLGDDAWSIAKGLGYLFAPIAWLIGVESRDCFEVGRLLGIRTVLNEFIAYDELGKLMKADAPAISPRSAKLATYALCGFCNIGSIGIQLGGIGAMAPERRGDLARLGLRAMIGGTLACFMTACVAGMLI